MRIGHGGRHRVLARILMLGAGALTAATLAPRIGTAADRETVLHSFCYSANCDGELPVAGVIRDASGKLYGTTSAGGAHTSPEGKGGTVFELAPPATGKTAWTHKVLYSFCALGGTRCTDGETPEADLIMDASRHLYGTTTYGGAPGGPAGNGGGTVFELIPKADKTGWTETVLYSFCAISDCADGALPVTGLIGDTSGNLYGTTYNGGASRNRGVTAFELTP